MSGLMLQKKNLFLSLLLLLLQSVSAEVIPLQLILDATSEEVHYIKGWLEAPSYMDLTELKFVTTSDPIFENGDDDFIDDAIDDYVPDDNIGDDDTNEGDDTLPDDIPPADDTPSPVDTSSPVDTPAPSPAVPGGDDVDTPTDDGDGGDGGDAPTESPTVADDGGDAPTDSPTPADDNGDDSPTDPPGGDDNGDATPTDSPTDPPADGGDDNGDGGNRTRRFLDGSISQRTTQVLDFVVFMLPDDCVKNAWGGCSWAALGVGARDDEVEGEISYCCSEDTVARDLCGAEDLGKLIIDKSIFKGDHRQVDVPTDEDTEFYLTDSIFKQDVSGDYIMVLGNCDDYGMDVLTVGSMEWKSVRGNLPGDMYDLMLFYVALTLVYLVLLVCYGCGMRIYQEAAIPIQKFIAATIVLGLLELTFRALDLGLWNAEGSRQENVAYISLALGVLKRGISRCLGVMVAMGWGVVRESLGTTLVKIIFLGMLYSGLTLFRDIFVVVAAEKVETVSVSAEEELIDFALLLTPIIIVINLIFYFWILRSLNATTEYLQNMGQTTKLQRHSRLRCVFVVSMIVAGAWLAFTIYDVFADVLSTDQLWILEGIMHVNYLFMLLAVAFLWRPNSNARDYAMQMELPAFGEDDENELELSCVVPSAGDMDDGNDPDHPNGMKVNGAVMS